MPEQIISASGTQYGMAVNEDGSINTIVTGSILIGSVTANVDAVYIQSGDNINLGTAWTDVGSMYLVNPVGISGTSNIGSVVISSSVLLGVSGDKLDKLSGSFGVTALPGDLGSVVISSSNLIGVSGAIFNSGNITGSVVISSSTKLGVSGNITVDASDLDIRNLTSASDSVEITGTSEIGSVVISSAPLIGISGLVFTQGNIVGSFAPKGIGSVVIKSAPLIGVSGLIFTGGDMTGSFSSQGVGSVIVQSSNLIGVSGLIFTDGNLTGSMTQKGIGSVVIKSAPLIGVSGGIFDSGNITGSIVISSAPLIGVSGDKLNKLVGSVTVGRTVEVSGGIFTGGDITGSVVLASSSKLGISGPVWVQNPVGISGTNVIGSVVIKSAPLIGVSGLIFTDGNITGSMSMQGVGSVIIHSSNLIGVSGAIFNSGDITGSVVVSSSTKLGVSGIVEVSGIQFDFTQQLIQRMDYEDEMQPIYMGLALPGTATSTDGWQLKKMEYSGTSSNLQLPVAVLFGSGNTNFDKEWDNRSGTDEEYS